MIGGAQHGGHLSFTWANSVKTKKKSWYNWRSPIVTNSSVNSLEFLLESVSYSYKLKRTHMWTHLSFHSRLLLKETNSKTNLSDITLVLISPLVFFQCPLTWGSSLVGEQHCGHLNYLRKMKTHLNFNWVSMTKFCINNFASTILH